MSCVYAIICTTTGKVYVGQATEFKSRIRSHKSGLNRGTHYNRHLLFAWRKYGVSSFRFVVLQECDRSVVHQMEMKWALIFGIGDHTRCFNTGTPGPAPMSGRTVSAVTCERIGVVARAREAAAEIDPAAKERQRAAQHKKMRRYVAVSPTGEVVTGVGVTSLCRKYGLHYSAMTEIANDRLRLKTHRGWTICYVDEKVVADEAALNEVILGLRAKQASGYGPRKTA